MSTKQSVREQNRNVDEDWYHIRILEPLSGQIRTLCLYDGISSDEVKNYYQFLLFIIRKCADAYTSFIFRSENINMEK